MHGQQERMQPPMQQQSKQQNGASWPCTVVVLRLTFVLELLLRTMMLGCGGVGMALCVLEVLCSAGSQSGAAIGVAST